MNNLVDQSETLSGNDGELELWLDQNLLFHWGELLCEKFDFEFLVFFSDCCEADI